MKLWLLGRKTYAGYDEAQGFVVRAKDARSARKLAQAQGGDEVRDWGPKGEIPFWTNPRLTTCQELKPEGPERVILRDFNAG